MRIREVFPAKNYILYVTSDDNRVFKYDMSELIDKDPDYYELKYDPDVFIRAMPVNENRSIGWGEDIVLSVKVIERNGKPVNMGFLEIYNDELEELLKHGSEQIVKSALNNRYGSHLYFEEGAFLEFFDWLSGGFASNLDKDDEPTDLALMYERMEDRMTWLDENDKDWLDDYR